MTVGELRRRLAEVDSDALQIEIIVPYEDEDGDVAERAYDVASVAKWLDPDTKGEYVGITCDYA
jgi:hypothetical protein